MTDGHGAQPEETIRQWESRRESKRGRAGVLENGV